MKAETSELTDGTQGFVFVGGVDTLCGIFNYRQPIFVCNVHYHIHLAAYSCIVNGNDRFCFWGNGSLNKGFVHVHRSRIDVYKRKFGLQLNKCVCR